MTQSYVNSKNLLKFLLGSALGIVMFLVPIPQGDSFTTLLDFVKSFLKDLFGPSLNYILVAIIVGSAVLTVYDYLCKPDWIRKNHYLSKAFCSTPLYLVSKILGAVFVVMVVFKIGPEYVTSIDTGATMVDLCATLFCIVLGFSFFLPFLTDCGIMEFLGVLLKPVVRPLFHVPGRASIDLIASWFGASNAAVILTREQYMKGFYTKREAGYIMTNFSIVSIPFCLLIANTVNISHLFPSFYLCICVVGVLLAVIIARIPPISLLPDTYQERTGKQLNEDVPQQTGLFHYALESRRSRYPDRLYRYVRPRPDDYRHHSGKNQICDRRALSGADHLYDRGGSHHHQERDSSEFLEAVCHLHGAHTHCHSPDCSVCQSGCILIKRNKAGGHCGVCRLSMSAR